MPTSPDTPIEEILTRQRIADAFATLANPATDNTQVSLTEHERRSIAQAVDRTDHHMARFAHTVLDEWDQLDLDDQVAGLLLFTEITNHYRNTRRELGVQR
jgi:hypothetical protein